MLDRLRSHWHSNYSHSTCYTRRHHLQELLTRLTAHGAPPIKLPRMKQPPVRTVIAAPEELEAALSIARPFERLLVLLCWHTALRSNEAMHVSTSAWDRENATITVPVKGGDTRTVPTTPAITQLLEIAALTAAPGQSAIAALKSRPTISRQIIDSAWFHLKKKAGIRTELRLHDLRRTTITQLYRVSKDLQACQQLAGHQDLHSTVRYIAPLTEGQLREYQKLLAFHSEVKQ